MADTPLLGITYPNENQDPYWTTIRSLFLSQDEWLQVNLEDKSLLVYGGGTMTLLGSTFSWSAPLYIVSQRSVTKITIAAGSVSVADGEVLYVTTGARPITNQTLVLQAGSPTTKNDIPIGYRSGAIVYIKDLTFLSGYELDDAYNASAGASDINVDAGDVTWDLVGAYSFAIDTSLATGTVDGFQVVDGSDYLRIIHKSANNLDLESRLQNAAFNTSQAFTADANTNFSLDAVTASNLTVSGATADLTLGARSATITLNELGDTALSGGFTATSLIGAINENAASITNHTLDDAYDASAGASTITVDAGDVTWNCSSNHSFVVDLSGILTDDSDGFEVLNGADYIKAYFNGIGGLSVKIASTYCDLDASSYIAIDAGSSISIDAVTTIDWSGTNASLTTAGALAIASDFTLTGGGSIVSTAAGDITMLPDSTGRFIVGGSSTALPSSTPFTVIQAKSSDTTSPFVQLLLRNENETVGGSDYQNEVHLRLQAGASANHRAYINFADFNGVDKWVTGKNANSVWILYNSETVHRLWMESNVGVYNSGNTYINAADSGVVRVGYHPTDSVGTGGFEIYDGGAVPAQIATFGSTCLFYKDVQIRDNNRLYLGSTGGTDVSLEYATNQASGHALVQGLSDDSNNWIVTNRTYTGKDFDRAASANPTLYMFADTDPDSGNTLWGSLSHNQTNFIIGAGTGFFGFESSDGGIYLNNGGDSTNWVDDSLSMGFDTVGGDSWIQSGSATAAATLFLNPQGGNVGAGIMSAASYAFSVGSTDGSNQVGIYHDNTDAYFTTDDGSFVFMTDEGTNTPSYLDIKGKGTGVGHFRTYDEDDAEYLDFYCSNSVGYIKTLGSSPGNLYIQDSAHAGIYFFTNATSGETQELKIYGYRAADAKRSLEIGVGTDAADTASFDGLSNYLFDGNVETNGNFTLNTGGSITTTSSGNIDLIPNGTGITTIGGGTGSHTLNAPGDLFVSGELEVDGVTYFDNTVNCASGLSVGSSGWIKLSNNVEIRLGSSSETTLDFSSAQTNNSLVWGLDNTSRSIIFCEKADTAIDFTAPNYTDPTIRIQSSDATNVDQFGILQHNQTDFIIDSGTLTTKFVSGLKYNVTTVAAATYDLLASDYIVHVTYTGTGAVTSLTLPSAQAVSGRFILIKDAGGNASANNITIDTGGAETIDGSATLVMSTDYESVFLYSDGTNWFTSGG